MIIKTNKINFKINKKNHLKIKPNFFVDRQYPELEDLEITPLTEEQTFKSANYYGYDEVKVKEVTADIDENIKPEHIKAGVSILEVAGSFEGIDTSDATATENDILEGKTAYVNGEKITGNFTGSSGSSNVKITNGRYLFYYDVRTDYLYEIIALMKDVTNMASMFENCTLENLNLSDLDASNVTTMEKMFSNCSKLKSLNLSNFNTGKVNNMAHMFNNCSSFTTLDLSNFNTSEVTLMNSMIRGCNQLTTLDLTNFDTNKVTDMSYMFYYDNKLTYLDLSSFNFENVTNMSNMFYTCTQLETLKLGEFKNSKVKYASSVFASCSKLKSLNLSNIDASNVIDIYRIISGCVNLIDLQFMKNLGKGYTQKTANYNNYKVDITNDTNLTHESIMDIFNNLYDLNLTYDVANGGTLYTQTIAVGGTNKTKLTAEEIAIATAKGWTVS